MKKTSRPQLALRETYDSFCVYTPTTGCWA